MAGCFGGEVATVSLPQFWDAKFVFLGQQRQLWHSCKLCRLLVDFSACFASLPSLWIKAAVMAPSLFLKLLPFFFLSFSFLLVF